MDTTNEWWPHLKAQLNDCTGSNQLFEWTWPFQHLSATNSIHFFHYSIRFVFAFVRTNVKDRDSAHWIEHWDKLTKKYWAFLSTERRKFVNIWAFGFYLKNFGCYCWCCRCCYQIHVQLCIYMCMSMSIRMNKHDIVFQKVHRIVCKIAHEYMVSNGFTRIVLRQITNGPMQSNKSLPLQSISWFPSVKLIFMGLRIHLICSDLKGINKFHLVMLRKIESIFLFQYHYILSSNFIFLLLLCTETRSMALNLLLFCIEL